jgi:hypothetical protein
MSAPVELVVVVVDDLEQWVVAGVPDVGMLESQQHTLPTAHVEAALGAVHDVGLPRAGDDGDHR